MNYFREMPLVRVLFLALVFVVCFGVLGSGEAFAKHEMQNGHEGDPDDGMDIVGGGGGEGNPEEKPQGPFLILVEIKWVSVDGSFQPMFYFVEKDNDFFSTPIFSKFSKLKWGEK